MALRAANWALALELIRSASLTPDFWRAATRPCSITVYSSSVTREQLRGASNHFSARRRSLLCGDGLRDLPCGQMWDRQCRDGSGRRWPFRSCRTAPIIESSVPYHRLVTELFMGAARVAISRADRCRRRCSNRLETMVDFLQAVMRPDGLMAQVGDADDGRLHI